MRGSAKESRPSAILLGAILAASAPVAADADSSITSWVNEALRHDPLVPASEISVSTQTGLPITVGVEDGVVSLAGSVGNAYQKRLAVQTARRVSHVTFVENELLVKPEEKGDLRQRLKSHAADVPGRGRAVREVVNEIRVQPAIATITKHSDARLARQIRDSFRRHWTTSRVAGRIRVGVKHGVATLTGDLDTWDEQFEAGRVAFGIEGVSKVQNRLTVKGYHYEWEKWEYEAPYYYEELFPNVA